MIEIAGGIIIAFIILCYLPEILSFAWACTKLAAIFLIAAIPLYYTYGAFT